MNKVPTNEMIKNDGHKKERKTYEWDNPAKVPTNDPTPRG
jgi:hypothetical protein